MPLVSYIPFVALSAIAVALFAYWLLARKELRHIAPVIIAIIASAAVVAIAYPQSLWPPGFLAYCIAVAAISSLLPTLYRKKPMAFMLAVFVLAFGAAVSLDKAATIGMFGVGTLIGALYFDRYLSVRREDRAMRKTRTEMERDVFQMALGLVVLSVMLIWQLNYIYILFWIVLLAYLFNNLISRRGAVYRALSRFERKDVEYGMGAIHIAAGLAILLGFAGFRIALFGVFPLFFSDSIATLTGISFYRSNKLPYNRRKTVAGTLAFLVATLVPGVLLLGLWGVPIAIILTIVESVDMPVDDNVAVPIVTVILGRLIGI